MRSRSVLAIFTTMTLTLAAGGLVSSAAAEDAVGMGTEEVPRDITITMTDQLRFDPDVIDVMAGETVRFVLVNPTAAAHDFTLGDLETQELHNAQMAAGMTHDDETDHDDGMADDDADHDEGMADDDEMAADDAMEHGHDGAGEGGLPAPVTIKPRETVTVVATFAEPGEVLIGCHQPGHWQAGMRGTIAVADA